MKIIIKQIACLLIAFAIVAACIWFIPSGIILNPLCIGFVMILGAFLGLDLAKMIQTTSLMPPGEFQPINMWRYIMSAILLAALFAESAYQASLRPSIDFSGSLSTLAFGVLSILGLIVSGIQGNKIVTGGTDK